MHREDSIIASFTIVVSPTRAVITDDRHSPPSPQPHRMVLLLQWIVHWWSSFASTKWRGSDKRFVPPLLDTEQGCPCDNGWAREHGPIHWRSCMTAAAHEVSRCSTRITCTRKFSRDNSRCRCCIYLNPVLAACCETPQPGIRRSVVFQDKIGYLGSLRAPSNYTTKGKALVLQDSRSRMIKKARLE